MSSTSFWSLGLGPVAFYSAATGFWLLEKNFLFLFSISDNDWQLLNDMGFCENLQGSPEVLGIAQTMRICANACNKKSGCNFIH